MTFSEESDETSPNQSSPTMGATEKRRKRLLCKQRSFESSVEQGEKNPSLDSLTLPFGHQRGTTLRGRKLAARGPYKIGVRFKRGAAACVTSGNEGAETVLGADAALLTDTGDELIEMKEISDSKEIRVEHEEVGTADTKLPESVVIDVHVTETEPCNAEKVETNLVGEVKIPAKIDSNLKELITEEDQNELNDKDDCSKSYTDIIALIDTSYKETPSNDHCASDAPGLSYKEVQLSTSKFVSRAQSKKSTDSDRSVDSETHLLDSPQGKRRTSNGPVAPSKLSLSSSFPLDKSGVPTNRLRPWHRLYSSGDLWRTKLSSGPSTSSEDIGSDDFSVNYVPPNRYIAVKLSPETDV